MSVFENKEEKREFTGTEAKIDCVAPGFATRNMELDCINYEIICLIVLSLNDLFH